MHIDRVEFLGVEFNQESEPEVLARLRSVTAETPFGYIVTPNVDHVVRLSNEELEPALDAAYADADLCVCDSRILAMLARLRGIHLPVVTGSDLTAAILNSVIVRGDRAAVVGGSAELVQRLSDLYPDVEFVHHLPPMGLRRNVAAQTAAATFISQAKCRFTFIAVGSPQQELVAARVEGGTGFGLCIGAALEFLTGDQVRAPMVVRRFGLEWAHRLMSDPGRLWRRYLVEGPQVFLLAWRWKARRVVAGRPS